jgi:hypothetical protein
MGYGGSRKGTGQAIGKVGDEGIDGLISEDRLGLGDDSSPTPRERRIESFHAVDCNARRNPGTASRAGAMREDPIVQETRQARAKLFAECNEDLDKLLDRLKASEDEHRDRVVTIETLREKRRPKDPRRLTTG